MTNLLNDAWYYEPPIDFEHKQYKLFAYLKTVDESFYSGVFSPYLLHTEKLVEEMRISVKNIESFSKKISMKKLVVSWEGMYLLDSAPKLQELDTVVEIIKFSIPLLVSRVKLGNDLLRRTPRLLY